LAKNVETNKAEESCEVAAVKFSVQLDVLLDPKGFVDISLGETKADVVDDGYQDRPEREVKYGVESSHFLSYRGNGDVADSKATSCYQRVEEVHSRLSELLFP
jgi:hypothetical protein